jgi:hypothetical protein
MVRFKSALYGSVTELAELEGEVVIRAGTPHGGNGPTCCSRGGRFQGRGVASSKAVKPWRQGSE